MVHRSYGRSPMWYWADGAKVHVNVTSAWCMLEGLRCKENDRKLKIEGNRRVYDG